jgi:TolB protein
MVLSQRTIGMFLAVLAGFCMLSLFRLVTMQPLPIIGFESPIPEDHKQILFVSDKTGNQEIYQMDLTNKRITNLTNHPSQDMNPQLSPDGKSIVFYSHRSSTNQIYSMNLKSKKVTRLTNNMADDYDPTFSPNGQQIVFKSTRDDGHGDIFIMNVDGSDQRNITATRPDTEEWDPVFNLDGEKILFVVRENGDNTTDEIYSMNRDGSNLVRLTNNNVSDWYPAVNPVSGEIVYTSVDPKTNTDALFTMDVDGTDKKQLANIPGYSSDPSWNAEGNAIIFINKHAGQYDIYSVNLDKNSIDELLSTEKDKLSPIFL